MILNISDFDVIISPDKKVVDAYKFHQEYNNVIKIASSSIYVIYRTDTTDGVRRKKLGFVISNLVKNLVNLSDEYLVSNGYDSNKDELHSLIKPINIADMADSEIEIEKNICLLKTPLILFYEKITHKIYLKTGYKFNEAVMKKLIEKADVSFKKIEKRKYDKSEYLKKLSDILTECPFSGYYYDLITALNEFSLSYKIIDFCSCISGNCAFFAVTAYGRLFYIKNKQKVLTLLRDGKFDEFHEKVREFYWFDEDVFVSLLIKDLYSGNSGINRDDLDMLINNLNNIVHCPCDYMDKLTTYKNDMIFVEKLVTDEGKKELIDIVRRKKLLEYAKLYDKREGLFSAFICSTFITSIGFFGVIFMLGSATLLGIISFISPIRFSLSYIRVFLSIFFALGGITGFYEWIKYTKGKKSWIELTENSNRSLDSVENEIDEYYLKYKSVIEKLEKI